MSTVPILNVRTLAVIRACAAPCTCRTVSPARRGDIAASIVPARVTATQRSQPGDVASLEVLRYEQAIQHACAEMVATACRDGEVHAAQPVLISSNSAPARNSSS